MANLRFELGNEVMCNLGEAGWRLGRIIALYYRKGAWPADREASYQVMVEDDHIPIYVPADDDRPAP
ncbi:MAG: hypothetical protein AAF711_00975 [Planctomycetota bacterium]